MCLHFLKQSGKFKFSNVSSRSYRYYSVYFPNLIFWFFICLSYQSFFATIYPPLFQLFVLLRAFPIKRIRSFASSSFFAFIAIVTFIPNVVFALSNSISEISIVFFYAQRIIPPTINESRRSP